MARRSGFTSPQRNVDIERLRQEVEREHARVLQLIEDLRTEVDSDITTAVGASFVTATNTAALPNERRLTGSASIDISDNGPNSTIVPTVIASGVDHGGLTGLGGDDHTHYFLASGLRALTGNLTMTAPSPSLVIGNGTGAPSISINKSDAANVFANWQVAGTTRGSIAFSSNENFILRLHDAGGSVAYSTNYLTTTGAWSFPGDLSAQAANVQVIGDTANYWATAHLGTTRLRDSITAPAATVSYATSYVDSTDGNLKTIFSDSAILTHGPDVTCQSVVVVARSTTDTTVVSSNAITAVFTGSVPSNSLGANGIVRVTLVGELLNNDGAGRTLLVRLRFGGVTHYQSTTGSIVNDPDPRPVRIVYEIANQGATNVQAIGGEIRIGGATPPTTGRGGALTPVADFATVAFTGANGSIDTTAARDVEIAIQHSASSANLSFTRRYAFVEVVTT